MTLVRALWKTNNHELRSAGIYLLERHQADLGGRDMALIESLLRASRSWAYVDWLCTRVVAPIVEREPAQKRVLATVGARPRLLDPPLGAAFAASGLTPR